LATGVPLLSTCTGHVEKEFGEFIFLLEKETPQELAKMITFIEGLYAPSLVEMGRRAQEYVLHHKTWEAQVDKLQGYIEGVFDGRRAA
jgi:hypothetical protein